MSSELRIAFQIKTANIDIDEAWLPVSTAEKLGLTARVLLPGMISFHEEHLVRTSAGYKLKEWYELDPLERAFEVAIRRLEGLLNRHVMEASK